MSIPSSDGFHSLPIVRLFYGFVTNLYASAQQSHPPDAPRQFRILPEIEGITYHHGGAPHQPGNQIPTCTQMKQYVAGVLTPTVSTSVPTTTAADAGGNMLPTTIVGDKRDSLLGTPAAYIEVGDYIIPAYKKKA